MKEYLSPDFEIVRFRMENVLDYSIENDGDDDVETPVIPFRLPQVDVGSN